MSLTIYENDNDLQIEEATNHVYDPNTTTTSHSSSSAHDSEIDEANYDEDLESTRATSVQKNVNVGLKNDDLKSLYQANSLAAAQMLQLMSSAGSVPSSATPIASSHQELLSNNSVGGENEKENIPICKYCNKIFANFSNLNHHISAIHLNQSKWICSQCGKVCSSKSNLKVHLRVHLRVKPYHCRWCSYSCMHHSSIRDHLAKVHPEKTHTPLQPGYIFNSQAVPEPDVFNSKGFNISSFVNDTNKQKRTNEKQQNDRTPEKVKRSRVASNETQNSYQAKQAPVSTIPPNNNSMMNTNMSYHTNNMTQNNVQISPTSTNNQSMSNIYNAYTMARMLPFMYPMQLQYAAAAAAAANQQQQHHQHQQQSSVFLNNLMQYNQAPNQYNPNFGLQINQQRLYSTNVSNASNSFEEQTTSSYSNSHSSRSSSLSPTDKTTSEIVNLVSKQIKSMATSIDDKLDSDSFSPNKQTSETQTAIETQTNEVSDDSGTNQAFNSSSSSPSMASSPKHNTLTVDQILSNKSNKSTQTDSACLKCPYCSNKAF